MIISSLEQGKAFLTDLLKPHVSGRILSLSNGGEARRQMGEESYDLIVINTPLSDEMGHELAIILTQNTDAGILMLVKAELADEVAARVEDYGVLVISKPVSRQLFFQSVKMAIAVRKRLLGLRKENRKLQQRIEDIRMVDRAKCVLIQYLKLTEQEAHRYIEKQAMDMRLTRREVAEQILKRYES